MSTIERIQLILNFLKTVLDFFKKFFSSVVEEPTIYTYILLVITPSEDGGKDVSLIAKRKSKQDNIVIPKVYPFTKKIVFIDSDNKKKIASVTVKTDDLAEALHVLQELGFSIEPSDSIIDGEDVLNGLRNTKSL